MTPSEPAGDAPCPHCGVLLWFVVADEEIVFFDKRRFRFAPECLGTADMPSVGDRVRISDGTFQAFEGVVRQIDAAAQQVTVGIELFGREIPLVFELRQIEPRRRGSAGLPSPYEPGICHGIILGYTDFSLQRASERGICQSTQRRWSSKSVDRRRFPFEEHKAFPTPPRETVPRQDPQRALRRVQPTAAFRRRAELNPLKVATRLLPSEHFARRPSRGSVHLMRTGVTRPPGGIAAV